jgi:ABC-type transporter Mla MlaB component
VAAAESEAGHTVRARGDFTIADHRSAQQRLESEIEWGKDLVLDLGEIGKADSIALVVFIGIVRKMRFNERSVKFANVPSELAGLIGLYEVGEFFKAAGDE